MKINPCPFCGSESPSIDSNGRQDVYVSCDDCGARGPKADEFPDWKEDGITDENKADAIKKWNDRK